MRSRYSNSRNRLWLNPSATQEAQQSVGWAGDSTGCQLRLDWYAVAQYESGVAWDKLDATN